MAIQLATVEELAQRTNVSLNAGESEVFESVLNGATTMLEMVLQTELGLANVIDHYKVNESFTSGSLRLWTTRQFLREDSVGIYLSPYGVLANTSTTSPIAKEAAYIDLKKGAIDILEYVDTSNLYAIVTYSAGFTNGDETIPSWMKEAALSAAVWLHKMQATRQGKKFDTIELDRELYRIMRAQVSTHLFSQYAGFTPHHSIMAD